MKTVLISASVLSACIACKPSEVDWPSYVQCAPPSDTMLDTVADILNGDNWRDALIDLAKGHGADTVACAVDTFTRNRSGGTLQSRASRFMDEIGTETR